MSDSNRPFRILVLADFSGRAGRASDDPGPAIAKRRLVRVDRDSLDDAVRAMSPRVRPSGGDDLRFAALDDFRPESLAGKLPAVAELRRLRARLFDPRSGADAAEEARGRFGAVAAPAARERRPEAPRADLPADAGDLLGAILESAAPQPSGGDAWDDIVRDVSREGVEKLRVPQGPVDRDALAARVDAEIGAALRGAMHDRGFAAVEAAWRSIDFLVRRLDLGSEVQLHLLDVSRAEAFADVGVSGGFDASGLHRVIVENTVGTEGAPRWSLVVADWTFDAAPRDVAALLRLAKLASAAQAKFVAGADPRVVGCRSLGATPDPEEWREAGDPAGRELWKALRRLPEASNTALAWPRILLRLPYGAKTNAVDGLEFEEFVETPDHERLLWGGGAFAVAAVLGRAYEAAGDDFADALDPEIEDLPSLVLDRDGEAALQPCAEAWLRTRGIDRAAAQGLLPLVSVQGAAAVRLANLHSLADPPTRLV